MKHILKIQERFFDQIESGEKTFEIRKNDRDFQVGDLIEFKIILFENAIINMMLQITNVFQEEGFGLKEGFCILSFKKLDLGTKKI